MPHPFLPGQIGKALVGQRLQKPSQPAEAIPAKGGHQTSRCCWQSLSQQWWLQSNGVGPHWGCWWPKPWPLLIQQLQQQCLCDLQSSSPPCAQESGIEGRTQQQVGQEMEEGHCFVQQQRQGHGICLAFCGLSQRPWQALGFLFGKQSMVHASGWYFFSR